MAPTPAREEVEALRVEDLHTFYGESHILRGASLSVPRDGVTAVLGRNGAGKTTLVESIMALTQARLGKVELFGENVMPLSSWQRARCGVQLVRQGRHIFPSLTARENVDVVGGVGGKRDWNELARLFPSLEARADSRGGDLSGGEQQMLAIARALRAAPRLLMLDEPSEGLAPRIVSQVEELIRRLPGEGTTVLLVEQSLPMSYAVADRIAVLAGGKVVFQGDVEEFRSQEELQAEHLGA